MATHRVVFEIEVEAENSFEAARTVRDWLRNPNTEWQFYVQNEQTEEIMSVDLSEEDEDAVLPAIDYTPLIKTP
jgi:hypothetical protein